MGHMCIHCELLWKIVVSLEIKMRMEEMGLKRGNGKLSLSLERLCGHFILFYNHSEWCALMGDSGYPPLEYRGGHRV